MAEGEGYWIFASYINHLEQRIGTRVEDAERKELCEFARNQFESIDRCNALFHGVTRAIHLTEVVLATLEGRWLLAKRVDPLELRHVLLGVWCHSAAFADTLAGDTRLPRGISNDGWWPWVSDRSATLCTHAGQSIQGTDVPQLVAFAQACGFSRVASENQSEVPESPDNELIQQVHGAWLISLASEAVQATKLKPLWTALQYWSDQSSGAPLELPGSLPEWIDFRSYWKSILSQWSSGAMAPAIELLELTEDGRDHLEHLRRALQ